jgi:hypothetical protein
MRRSHTIMLVGVVLMTIGIVAMGRDTTSQQTTNTYAVAESPTMVVTSESTPTVVSVTLTAEPQVTATMTAQSVSVGQLVWQDSFDNVSSGWEQTYTAPLKSSDAKVNNTAYNGYENGAYRFVLNNQMQGWDWLLWDFNTTQQLPNYPYAVEVDVRATREHTGALILDYRGDVADIDKGDGVFVRFHLGESPNTPKQAWSLLGIDQGNDRLFSGVGSPFAADLYALEVYESLSGQRYELACSELVMPLATRAATLRVEVDAMRVYATLTDRNNPTNVVDITCQRIPTNVPSTSPANIGLVGIHTERVVPIPIDYALDFEDLRVFSIDTVVASEENITTKPLELIDTNCDTEFPMSMRSRLTSYNSNGAFCGAFGDWGVWEIGISRYEPRVDEFVGRWQCGNDPEGVIELFKQDWRVLIRFINQEIFYLYSVSNSYVGGDQPHLILWSDASTQPGDSISSLPTYFLAYNDTDLVASWAGMCTRLP